MQKLTVMDRAFLLAESREAPMHVGGVNLYTLPEGVDEQEWMSGLRELLTKEVALRHPFGQRLKMTALGMAGPIYWEEDPNLDMHYHVRHSALPKPGLYRELFALVSRLHSTLLDRSRPLWEFHLIEGLQDRQFAIYTKFHHCAIDGAGSMHLQNSMHSNSPEEYKDYSPFSLEAYQKYKSSLVDQMEHNPAKPSANKQTGHVLRDSIGSTRNILRALGQTASAYAGRDEKLAVPWRNIPKTSFNTRITGARRFVAQTWQFQRVYAVGKELDGTLNDTVLAMCAGALRKYLQQHHELPAQSLKAMAPISLRAKGDLDSANAVASLCADLATNIADPEARYRRIRESMIAGKQLMQRMSPAEIETYTGLTQLPGLSFSLLGIEDKFPAFSVVVSNVPGSREQMYWNGAKMAGSYPMSAIGHGSAINITLVSNGDNLDVGIVACRETVPSVQRLIDYMEDALLELEQLADIVPRKSLRKVASVKPASKAPRKKAVTTRTVKKGAVKKKAAGKPSGSRKKQ
jgi:WS/DGAT/MGAT family acyltransferase